MPAALSRSALNPLLCRMMSCTAQLRHWHALTFGQGIQQNDWLQGCVSSQSRPLHVFCWSQQNAFTMHVFSSVCIHSEQHKPHKMCNEICGQSPAVLTVEYGCGSTSQHVTAGDQQMLVELTRSLTVKASSLLPWPESMSIDG